MTGSCTRPGNRGVLVAAARRWSRAVVGVVAVGSLLAVDVTAADVASATVALQAPAVPFQAKAARPKPVTEAADVVSARVAARAQGSRVEAVSERTEFLTTWVNPDGTLTTDASASPVRFRDKVAGGTWRKVDLSLRDVGGQIAPTSSDLGVSFAAGGVAADYLSVDHDNQTRVGASQAAAASKAGTARSVSWALGGKAKGAKLPKPTLSGNTATYANVEPGVDLRLTMRPMGPEQDFIVKDRAAAEAIATAGGALQIPLKTKGLRAKATAGGGVDFTDAKGKRVSQIPLAFAWDAKVDPRSGEPVKVPLSLSVAQTGAGTATLKVTPDAAWLADPARVFPLTIDPSYAIVNSWAAGDTWVATNYPTSDMSADPELKVGTYDGGTTKARSFILFPIAPFRGMDVVKADMSLWNTYSYSCAPATITAYRSGGYTSATRWDNQPSITSAVGSASAAKGYSSSCPGGRFTIPITNEARTWSSSSNTYFGIALKASETDSNGWKRFWSANGSAWPYVSITYNRKPNVAATPDLGGAADGANSYTAPGSSTAQVFTNDPTPKLHSVATDPDASGVAMTFEVHNSTTTSSTSLAASCSMSSYVASGSTTGAYCSPTTALAENKTYYVRAAVKDDRGLWNGTWSPWRTLYTSWSTPPTPQVSCTNGYGNGTWTDTDPTASVTCSIKAAGAPGTYLAPGYLDITVDGVKQSRLTITPTDDWGVVHKSFSFPASSRGYHEIRVTGVSRALKSSAQASYGFGWGAASMTTPTAGTSSSGKVKVTAGGPPKGSATAVTGKVQWRVAASGNERTGWTDEAAGAVTVTPSSATTPAAYTGVFDLTTALREAGASADIPSRTPVRLDVQVCFTYTGGSSSAQCTWSQSPVTVTRLPHAFGGGYPTTDAVGAGKVALYTGELAADATDVAVPGYSGAITLSRSHTSFAGSGTVTDWPTDVVTGIFGPGWSANLEGNQSGLAGLQVYDNVGVDGSIAFTDGEGSPLVYASPTKGRTYPTGTATYLPATDDTAAAAITLKTTGAGTGTRLTLTEEDGTATTWKPRAAPAPAGTTWQPDTISEPGQTGSTTFGDTNNDGRIDRIIAPIPAGFTGTCPTSGALSRGCRAIDITYATSTTATAAVPGDYTGQVKTVSAWLWDPTPNSNAGAMANTVVATYAYDTLGRLRKVRDPRTNIGPDYTWDAASTRIATVQQATPASTTLAATKLTYDTAGKLVQVARENPVAGQSDVTVARYVYGVPVSGAGLPDLSATATGVGPWYQAKAPAAGYAVFGPDYTGPVTGTGVDYTYADLTYVDDLGYTVNTASYGAGAWQVTSADYDTSPGAGAGNVVRTLDAAAITEIDKRAGTADALDAAGVDAMSTQTVYNDEIKDATTGAVTVPRGTRVTDTYGPARDVVLAGGSTAPGRLHTHTDYDEGAPTGVNPTTGQAYSLPTTVTTSAANSAGATDATDLETVSVTTSSYDKLSTGDATEGDGWALGAATRTTTWTSATSSTGAITTTTRYDTLGRVTETRQPMSNGSDAGTTKSAYYTADAQVAPNAACGGRPEWAGQVCRTYPAAAPSLGPTLPDQATTYSMWLQPITVTETSGTAIRATTTTYDSTGRVVSSKATASGLTGSTVRAGMYTKYRNDGLIDYIGTLNTAGTDADTTGRTTYTYDRWARTTTVTGDAGAVTTTFDEAGRVASVTDAKGTRTYGYDGAGTNGADAAGKTERRGLTTSLTISRAGTGGALTYRAAYDAAGKLVRQAMPGGLTQVSSYDEAGEPLELTYLGQVTPVTESTDVDGNTVYTPGAPVQDQPWLSWATSNDVTGRVRLQATGVGAAFDNGQGVAALTDVAPWVDANGQASSYAREYRYDAAGRLLYAQDAQATPNPATESLVSTCTERSYVFDANGRRTGQTTTNHPDGDCATTTAQGATTATAATTGWDTADRPTTGKGGAGSYMYDLFGRQTTVPAADAPNTAAGNITLGYFDDDLPRSITQGTTTTTFTLDANGRRSTQSTTTTGGSNPGTTTTVRRYTDDGDNPAWAETTAPGAPSANVIRFEESIGGDLSASIDQTGTTTLSLADPHGDAVTTVTVLADQASSTPAVAVNGWASYDEYGNPANASAVDAVDGTLGYGWLGAKQRSTSADTAGLTLMGVRLYNNTRGLFTSIDPVPGGSASAYAYPFDPVNQFDLNGQWWGSDLWNKASRKAASAWHGVTSSAAWNGTVKFAKKAWDNPYVRGVAVGLATAAVCSTGVGCILAGAAFGAAAGASNWAINHRSENLWRHTFKGAVSGAFSSLRGVALARNLRGFGISTRGAGKTLLGYVGKHRRIPMFSPAQYLSRRWSARFMWR